jgi:hypothetical protein
VDEKNSGNEVFAGDQINAISARGDKQETHIA